MLNFALEQLDFVFGELEEPIDAVVDHSVAAAFRFRCYRAPDEEMGMRGGAVAHIRATSSGVRP